MIRWLAAALFTVGPAAAQDVEDFIPDFGALDGAELTHSVTRSLDGYDMPTAQFTRDEQPVLRLEGRLRELVYVMADETSTLEAIRTYERSLTQSGYQILFECAQNECGGFDFRFNTFLVDPPAMRFDLADFRYIGASDDETGRHAAVIASRQGGKLFMQVVTVASEGDQIASAPVDSAPRPGAKPTGARLFALARRLTEAGHAPLEGIAFEAGSARLTLESTAALEQAARLLRARPDLRFLVVGHTDNDGALELNLELSLARARSVAEALAAFDGVEAGQFEAHGVGFLTPRASNASEAGRALNRRVELVLR